MVPPLDRWLQAVVTTAPQRVAELRTIAVALGDSCADTRKPLPNANFRMSRFSTPAGLSSAPPATSNSRTPLRLNHAPGWPNLVARIVEELRANPAALRL